MFTKMLLAFQKVRRVTTQEELEAVQRLRYRVYVEEGGDKEHYEADHQRKMIISDGDSFEGTRIYYVGDPEAPHATMRMRTWQAGQLPEEVRQTYSVELLPTVKELAVSEASAAVALPTRRGTLAVLGMMCHAMYDTIAEMGAGVCYATCVPGLLRKYQKLGFRAFGGSPISTSSGILLPVIFVLHESHLRKVGSPLLHVYKRLERNNKLPPTEPFLPLEWFLSGSRPVEIEEQAIAEELETSLQSGINNHLRESLPQEISKYLFRHGLVIEFEANIEVIQQGANNQDLYVVLEGTLDVLVNGAYLATLVQGDTFGEMALMRDGGQRTASVKTTSSCRLLVVRHSTLAKMEREDPAKALKVYKALVTLLMKRAGLPS